MEDRIFKLILVAVIVLEACIIVSTPSCRRNETKTVTTKKKGKTELVKSTETITFDTLKWIAHYKANTKPVIKWKKQKPDTIEVKSKPLYSPCDSVFASLDSGTINGIEFSIWDTIADNRVLSRQIKLEVPQSQITKQVLKVNDSLRVDTVYINQKQKWGTNAKWFFRGFVLGNGTGFVGGSFLSK